MKGVPRHQTVKRPTSLAASGHRRVIIRSNLYEKQYH